jgi:sugar phosphate isomerase/epimerase
MATDFIPPANSADRRSFLKSSVLGAGTLLASGVVSNKLPAAGPIERHSGPHMKLSLAAYSFNRYLDNGCELTGYYFPREITHDYLMQVKQKTFALGLDISGTAIGNDFCKKGEAFEAELKMTREWIDYAATLGAPVIRIFAGNVPGGDSEEAAVARCVEGIDRSLEYAAEKGVFLALENHGGITATPAQMLKLVEAVKSSPWFGVNFDGGNFRTDDPYRDLEQIAPYAINVQLKATVHRNGKNEPADLERMVDMLKKAGYRGYVVLEYEEQAEPKEAIPGLIEQLRKLTRA